MLSLLSSLHSPSGTTMLATAIPWVIAIGVVIAGVSVLRARAPQPVRVRASRPDERRRPERR